MSHRSERLFRRVDPRALLDDARRTGRRALDEASGKKLLGAFGIPVPRFVVVRDPSAVESAIEPLDAPFAVKVMSPDILHKSDAGGVLVGIPDAGAVGDAIARIAERAREREVHVDGYLVEEMCAGEREVVVGAVSDPCFGPLVMVGLGGVLVEVLDDVSFRMCPITADDARAMLAELRGARLLTGVRGEAAVDAEAIVDILLRIGGRDGLLARLDGEIAELDLNPVIVSGRGAVAVDARVILSEPPARQRAPRAAPRDELPVLERLMPLFAPRCVAVLGASTTSVTIANTFIRRMKDFGYGGTIVPIHPRERTVEGLAAYPSLADAPLPVDYAYVAVGAERIPDVLAAANGRVKFAQVVSSGFGEVVDGATLERALVAKAHAGGCRVVGPNCLGLYSPRGGVTFPVDAPTELGHVGVVSQSGGLGTDIVKRGQWRGLRFSAVVTAGNCADLGPADLLEFFLADRETRVIGFYLEDMKQGRRFFRLLRHAAPAKPVVILRGGKTAQGRAAAASHTGALAGHARAWEALSRQTGCVLVDTLDELLGALLALQLLEPRSRRATERIVLFGNGGGASVIAADQFAAAGLDVSPLAPETMSRLEALRLPPGTSVANPIDTPVRTLQEDDGRVANRILEIVYEDAAPDAVVMHLNLASFVGRGGVDPVDNLIRAALAVQHAYPGQAHFVIVLRVDGSPELDERKRRYRRLALEAAIPVFDELGEAARALAAVRRVEQHRGRTSASL